MAHVPLTIIKPAERHEYIVMATVGEEYVEHTHQTLTAALREADLIRAALAQKRIQNEQL